MQVKVRGGRWYCERELLRISYNNYHEPSFKAGRFSFRCCRARIRAGVDQRSYPAEGGSFKEEENEWIMAATHSCIADPHFEDHDLSFRTVLLE